jgi:hypothetical protein
MTDDEIARLEAEIAERTARLRELRPPLTLGDLRRMSPREVAKLSKEDINRALSTPSAPLDPYGPGGVTAEHFRAMSSSELVAFEKAHPEAYAAVLAGGSAVLTPST